MGQRLEAGRAAGQGGWPARAGGGPGRAAGQGRCGGQLSLVGIMHGNDS